MSRALILIDFINEFLHPEGKVTPLGMGKFVTENRTIANVRKLIDVFRQQHEEVIWVHLGFHSNYDNCSKISPRFASIPELRILQKDTWSTAFLDELGYDPTEKTITKTRVSPFYETDLESYLREQGIEEVVIAGVATDLAVSSMTGEAHDRDFRVTVIVDACGTTSLEHHEAALIRIGKLAQIKNTRDI